MEYSIERFAGEKELRSQQRVSYGSSPSNLQQQSPVSTNSRKRKRGQGKTTPEQSTVSPGTPPREVPVWRPPQREEPPEGDWLALERKDGKPLLYGAPPMEKDSHLRQPPRPQNVEMYKRQLAAERERKEVERDAKRRAEEAANRLGIGPGLDTRMDDGELDRFHENLQRFNELYPVHGRHLGASRPREF